MLVELNEEEYEALKKALNEANVNIGKTENFAEWTEKCISEIDDAVQEVIDNDSSADDSDIMSAAAEKINEIMDSNINEDSPLYPIIARELIDDWTSHIFRNWYTGDAAEEDYYLGILERM